MSVSSLLLLSSLLCACYASSGYGPDVWHVRLVDSHGANKLYRGGSPEVSKQAIAKKTHSPQVPERNYNASAPFNWTALTEAMERASALPKAFRVVMVNLESLSYGEGGMDGGHVAKEWHFFHKNPQKGALMFWRIVGADSPYPGVLDESRAWLVKNFDMWDSDQMSNRVAQLRTMLMTPTSLPTMIYIHCDCGCDRTGQIAGAYAMRYLNWTWPQTIEYNNAIEPDTPCMECPNYWALNWYCQSLGNRDCSKRYPCNPEGSQCVFM